VGSAESEKYDQVLDTVFVGPVAPGQYRFVFQVRLRRGGAQGPGWRRAAQPAFKTCQQSASCACACRLAACPFMFGGLARTRRRIPQTSSSSLQTTLWA
jgi:hypothetical protein